MQRGSLIGGRFEVESVAGSGGMGTVYRALDVARGGPVALKILNFGGELLRFEREAQILSDLAHPGIVRYIAHGSDDSGVAYLAMEWLDGESLSHRLARQTLTLGQSVDLTRRVAESLASPHARGVVHRDLKPSNLFLVGGDVATPMLLDFGVAHGPGDRRLTVTGTALGTPGYMAPEQARGESPIRPAADVFSLGCILFRCLTGRAPFEGDDVLDVLLKVVLEDPPRLRELRADVPDDLDELVQRMLAKPPSERPADASAVAIALDRLGALDGGAPPPAIPEPARLGTAEQRVVSLLIARPNDDASALRREAVEALLADPRAFASGAVHHVLLDGSQVFAFQGDDAPAERAARAADCARAFRREFANARVVLATGRGLLARDRASGEVLARAAALLRSASPGEVVVDDVTAGLLDARFEGATVARSGGHFALDEAVRRRAVTARTVLGKEIACVGRAPEIAVLEAVVDECIADRRARLAVVVAAPGLGKTRLVAEITERFATRQPGAAIWVASGEPVSAGSAYALLASMVARAADVRDDETLEERHEKLAALAARVPDERRTRVVQFLGELVGAPFSEAASLELAAARLDAILLGDHLLRAVLDLLETTSASAPLMIVLDDLQWGDGPSVRILEHALRNLEDRPLVVIAAGRPEVKTLFPSLVGSEGSFEVRLGPLSARASEALATAALGAHPDVELARRLAVRAQGHPLVLEELLRAHAAGFAEEQLPDGVLALVEMRLEKLPAEARRTLRAASIFGRAFWAGGVNALLGASAETRLSRNQLEALREGEVIVASRSPRFAGEDEYTFASALLRDATYATLTDDDRAVGHRLAAAWLEGAGERDARVLADHLERGEEHGAAAARLREAAVDAFAGNDFDTTLALSERALACITRPNAATQSPELVARLWLLRAEANFWKRDFAAGELAARTAMANSSRGSSTWLEGAGCLAVLLARTANAEAIDALAAEVEETDPLPDATRAAVLASARIAGASAHTGNANRAAALIARSEAFAARVPREPIILGRIAYAKVYLATSRGDSAAYLEASRVAVEAIEKAGDLRAACTWRAALTGAYLQHGAVEEAEPELRRVLEDGRAIGLADITAHALYGLGAAGALRGDHAGCIDPLRRAIDAAKKSDARWLESVARSRLAISLLALGRVDEARAEIDFARELGASLEEATAGLAIATARLFLSEDREADAADTAMRARGRDARGGLYRAELALVCVDALRASGDRDTALDVLLGEREEILAQAARIHDSKLRSSFLERVPHHARLLALAAEALA